MLTRELISPSLPILHLHDKVFNALQMMNDCHVTHLAVDDDGKYVGTVNEELLMQAPDDTVEIRELKESFPAYSVNQNDHFDLQNMPENFLSIPLSQLYHQAPALITLHLPCQHTFHHHPPPGE